MEEKSKPLWDPDYPHEPYDPRREDPMESVRRSGPRFEPEEGPVSQRIKIGDVYEYRVRVTDQLTPEAAAVALAEAEQVVVDLRRIALEVTENG